MWSFLQQVGPQLFAGRFERNRADGSEDLFGIAAGPGELRPQRLDERALPQITSDEGRIGGGRVEQLFREFQNQRDGIVERLRRDRSRRSAGRCRATGRRDGGLPLEGRDGIRTRRATAGDLRQLGHEGGGRCLRVRRRRLWREPQRGLQGGRVLLEHLFL